ncbi:hypothetical protein OGAPHI_006851 [Ogataea philodendri]|uniref:D-isomer specific 2-hydroxyacid dehydrogenase NAD-binding domain-containing protein n=1 Tax=Ogataea philodendri TaxID=1378263 RepID=A0A9P8T0R4_9ASCO|nr:uncharacterized protein OGAPHI_006851 [Ogataea philodendri]KAH3661444.1 hypothetical protein OGAPHI_006851 [Ogataea philodendri]
MVLRKILHLPNLKQMTADIAGPYPHPKKELGHAINYLTGNHDYDIPEKTKMDELATLRARLETKPSFNPNLKFDPKKHFVFKDEYYETVKQFSLSDLNIKKTRVKPVSDFAAAYPFPLLSPEAVDMVLWEAVRPDIVEKYGRLPNLAKSATRLDFHIGGHCSRQGPFTQAMLTSPILYKIIEGFCKVKVKALFSAGHFNFSLASNDPEEILRTEKSKDEQFRIYEAQSKEGGDEIPSSLGLHYDSSSFALVIMMDMGDDAVGGETGIVTGDDKFVRVPDPKVGYATLIQGMVLKHVATKPISNSNRITAVGGYCVSGPEMLDNILLTSVKPSILPRNNYDEFYNDWAQFRLKNLEEHIGFYRKKLMKAADEGKTFNQLSFIKRCREMERYLVKCWDEMEAYNNPPFPPAEFSTPYSELPDLEDRPKVLYIPANDSVHDDQAWKILNERFELIYYDCKTEQEYIEEVQKPNGRFSGIRAICRPTWLKGYPYVNHFLFRNEPVKHLPDSVEIIVQSGHGYDIVDLEYLTYAENCVWKGDYYGAAPLTYWGDNPSGRTLGIIGLGSIAIRVARACKAMDMNVVYHNRSQKPDYELEIEGLKFYPDLNEMLAITDCIFISCPYTPATKHLINFDRFKYMKDKVRLVNIARGPIVEEAAIIDALERGQLVGAGFDVHEFEPKIHPKLLADYRVTLLPHIGVASKDSFKAFERKCVENLVEYFYGNGKPSAVNKELLEDIN